MIRNVVPCRFTAILALLTASVIVCFAQSASPRLFDIMDIGKSADTAPTLTPWKVITLDPEYGGMWVVAGDLDGDGQAEIVSAENFNQDDTHYTSAVVAHRLNGSVIWRWGDPGIGRKIWHHDVACQIHDWDGDGKGEVIIGGKGFLVELEGTTGKEKRRWPIPEDASDCLVFGDLSGKGRPTDVLVKNRYHQIWAYNHEGRLLWTVKDPGGYKTAHQPCPIDLDGDGRDEIMAGYAMLNFDGSVRWVYQSKTVDLSAGHLDCMRPMRKGIKPEDFRLAITCCSSYNLALIDGNGKAIWERSGHHFESINIGRLDPSSPSPQILVDIDHKPRNESPLWLLDADGLQIGRLVTTYCRHHKLLDWTGDGWDEILVADNRAVYDRHGQRIATLGNTKSNRTAAAGESSLLLGDMTGDGIADVLIVTSDTIRIFKNTKGHKPSEAIPLGTGINVTLY